LIFKIPLSRNSAVVFKTKPQLKMSARLKRGGTIFSEIIGIFLPKNGQRLTRFLCALLLLSNCYERTV